MALVGSGWEVLLMLEFLKASFLILCFSYYTLMTFLMMLSVIMLSMPGQEKLGTRSCHAANMHLKVKLRATK